MTDVAAPAAEQQTLRDVVEALAPLVRRAGSPEEKQAAEWIAAKLQQVAGNARVEEEQFLDGYAPLMAKLSAVGVAAGLAGLASKRLRVPAAAAGLAAAAAIADDASNGPRVARKATQQPKTTWNVVAETGDLAAARTLVVCAHHDAAPTGKFFEQPAQAYLGERFPGVLERIDTSLPNWWPTIAAPALAGLGALKRSRRMMAAGIGLSALGTAAFADIARSPIVPGANDNLTAVALLVALAERLNERPIEGLRVMLVSLGAEEVLQGGIYGFMARHKEQLDRENTHFLNFDTVGSPELVMLEGEGTTVMEDYFYRPFRDLCARAGDRVDAPFRRGMRARNSTDAVIPSRMGYPIACFASMDRYKALSNYHLMSDTPENVDYDTVGHAVTIAEAVAHELLR